MDIHESSLYWTPAAPSSFEVNKKPASEQSAARPASSRQPPDELPRAPQKSKRIRDPREDYTNIFSRDDSNRNHPGISPRAKQALGAYVKIQTQTEHNEADTYETTLNIDFFV